MTAIAYQRRMDAGRHALDTRKLPTAISSFQEARDVCDAAGESRQTSREVEHMLGICWRMVGEALRRNSLSIERGAIAELMKHEHGQHRYPYKGHTEAYNAFNLSDLCFKKALQMCEEEPTTLDELLAKAGILRDRSALYLTLKRYRDARADALSSVDLLSTPEAPKKFADPTNQLPQHHAISVVFLEMTRYMWGRWQNRTESTRRIATQYRRLLGYGNSLWALNAGMRWLYVAPAWQRPAISAQLLKLALFDSRVRSTRRVAEIAALTLGFWR